MKKILIYIFGLILLASYAEAGTALKKRSNNPPGYKYCKSHTGVQYVEHILIYIKFNVPVVAGGGNERG